MRSTYKYYEQAKIKTFPRAYSNRALQICLRKRCLLKIFSENFKPLKCSMEMVFMTYSHPLGTVRCYYWQSDNF